MCNHVSIGSKGFAERLASAQKGCRVRVITPTAVQDLVNDIKKSLNVPKSRLFGISAVLSPRTCYNYRWKNYPQLAVTIVQGHFNQKGDFMVGEVWRGPSGKDRAYLNLSDYVKGVIIQRAQNI